MIISPLLAAAIIINVPASILSGIIVYLTGFNPETPLILTVSVPAPLILAPIDVRKLAIFTISGSFAAPSITVTQSPKTEFNIRFSVAPTLG